MRAFIITYVLTILTQTNCLCQDKLEQEYYNMSGERLEFFSDSTFKHTWHFDLASSWTNGKWSISNDTIYLNTVFIMDTLSVGDSNNLIFKDSLVLSGDQQSDRIGNGEYIISILSGGGQNRRQPPNELFLKNGKLYRILDNGELDKTKSQAILTKRKYKTYYKPIKK